MYFTFTFLFIFPVNSCKTFLLGKARIYNFGVAASYSFLLYIFFLFSSFILTKIEFRGFHCGETDDDVLLGFGTKTQKNIKVELLLNQRNLLLHLVQAYGFF
jgi:hypothetical protein